MRLTATTFWTDLPVRFAKADQTKVPDHWRTFGTRSSPITGATRRAANPANAILNYLYALLEAETRIATATAGLDPGIGILHADQDRHLLRSGDVPASNTD